MADLEFLARRQARLARLLKVLETYKKKVREEFFSEADQHFEESHWLLPMTSWFVPWEFFERTGISREEFVKTRFPSWNVQSTKEETDGVVYVLRKKKEYMPWSYQSDEFEISRSISEPTPEIDWDSMQKADPNLFKKFAKEVTTYELDADAFNEYMNSHPEFSGASFLMRHTKHKTPTLRVLSKASTKDE